MEFFNELKRFLNKGAIQHMNDQERSFIISQVNVVQQNYNAISFLFKQYKWLFPILLRFNPALCQKKYDTMTAEEKVISDIFKFGWFYVLVAKGNDGDKVSVI